MSEITLKVGGRIFSVACTTGEEDHVRALARRIDGKFAQLAPRYSTNLLFAALQLADELDEISAERSADSAREVETLKAAAQDAEAEIAALRETVTRLEAERAAGPADLFGSNKAAGDAYDLAPALERFAALLEDCAVKLHARNA